MRIKTGVFYFVSVLLAVNMFAGCGEDDDEHRNIAMFENHPKIGIIESPDGFENIGPFH